MCDSGGEPISYEQLIPPEQQAYRKALFDWINPSQQVPQYPGAIPYTQPFNNAQMGALDLLMGMAGMGAPQIPTLPGMPPSIGWGGNFNYPGGGGGTKYNDLTDRQKERYDNREDRKERERRERKDRYASK